jgi:hypothetical protein
MAVTTFEKSDFNWYGISIIPNNQTVDIFLLFRDMNDGKNFFDFVTKDNKTPSFYCILQPDKTHVLKIDYSSNPSSDDYIAVSCGLTIDNYEGLNRLKEDHNFKIIIGTEQTIDGQIKTCGTTLTFVPQTVQYLSEPEQLELPQESLN